MVLIKKIIALFIFFGLFSCQRDFNCECTITRYITDSGKVVTTNFVVANKMKSTKKRSKSQCAVGNDDVSSTSVAGQDTSHTHMVTTCVVK